MAILIIQNFRGLFIFSFLLLSPPHSSVHSVHFVHSVFIIRIIRVIMPSVPLLLCLLHTPSLMSLCLYVILSSVPLLLCLLHTLSPMSLCHSGFINVKYFYHLTILSVTCEWQVGQYLPFLSRTFRDKFVSIKKPIVYKIKQRRRKLENHKFIYVRRTGKEIKERKNRCKKKGFVYIFHNKGWFPPYSSHLTS